MNKIELLIPTYHRDRIVKKLQERGKRMVYLIPGVLTFTEDHFQLDDDVTGVFDHILIVTFCKEEETDTLSNHLMPELKRVNGSLTILPCRHQ